ncbi:DUF4097 domain-containing protein [Belliella sp. DSM 107340]|uniref:DUF4097 domain-containing protein n=1 Tax=Belliella calami TaxID=2923436 RepID=A0ABS9UK20_9BACT|nr:DUF4097 family beta strand repeat-containing protein [Belliella calami]MCH7396883.1 DUF4097 domain-containing protein [Belliella calami]
MFNKSQLILLVFGLAVLFSSCEEVGPLVTREYDETFSDIKEIEVTGKYLEVSYEGSENETVVNLNSYLEVSESSDIDLSFRKSGSKLIIEVTGDQNSVNFFNFGTTNGGFISLTGPEDVKLKFTNNSGSIDVKYVKSERIDLQVNSGSIKALALNVEKMNLKASSGSIKADGLVGDVEAQVNSGSITMKEVQGNVNANASSGSLRIEDVDGTVSGKVNSGSMRFDQISRLGDLTVSSGSINATNSGLGEETNLKSSSGSIKIQTPSDLSKFNFELVANSGSVKVGDQSGSKRLEIDNSSDITVHGKASSGSIKIFN